MATGKQVEQGNGLGAADGEREAPQAESSSATDLEPGSADGPQADQRERCHQELARSQAELAETKAELFATRQRLRAIMDALPVGVAFATDTGCQAIEGNPMLTALFGAQPGDNLSASAPDPGATGRKVRYLAGGHELSDAELPLQRAVAEQTQICAQELEIHTPDGRRWLAEVSAAPIRDQQGSVSGALAVVSDVTERKRAQEALIAADRRKDEFLAVLAHELRNPLAPIRNAAEVLVRQHGLPEPASAAAVIVARQSEHLERLVNDLLDLSRITHGRIQLQERPFRLQEAVEDSLQAIGPFAARAGIELQTRIATEPVLVRADPTRLAQVFTNLLSNAVKFSPRGARVWVTLQQRGDAALAEVRDEGIGIPAEELPRLFDLFARGGQERQGPVSSPAASDGLGIGLALARRLVEQHGGELSVHSDGCARGTSVRVRLPIDPAAGHLAAPAPALRPAALRPRRILVVDDNADVARALKLLLETLGQRVETLNDSTQVVDALRTQRAELVFLDIAMPGMDGRQVARAIRAELPGARPWLVALTGRAMGREQGVAAADFDRYLLKPASLATIETLLAELDGPRAPD